MFYLKKPSIAAKRFSAWFAKPAQLQILLKVNFVLWMMFLASLLWFVLAAFRPTITAVTPPNGADGVYPHATLAVSFSSPMDPGTINRSTILLRNSNGAPVPAAVSYDEGRRIAQITPDAPLETGATYELQVDGGPYMRPQSSLGLPLSESATARFKIGGVPPILSSSAPILVVTDKGNSYGAYYAEILLAEGLNLFSVTDVSQLTPEKLASTDLVIITETPSDRDAVMLLDQWVRAGGNLIAIRPKETLLPLLGLADTGTSISNGYLQADASSAASRGITRDTLQLRVPASRFELLQATAVAHLVEAATHEIIGPAVTLRRVGQGHAAAFAYDLAQSIIWTRQGNPTWINQERDGLPPRRTNDLFYPDYIDMSKVKIPQADEQQRLLANLILVMNSEQRPLPRFWYLPGGRKAVLIMAGDDHATKRGTRDAFALLREASPPDCRIDAWECYRATSYISVNTPVTSRQLKPYMNAGFEVGIHVDTGCRDQDNITVELALSHQIDGFGKRQFGLERQLTHRIHCATWNGWVDTARSERAHGIRLNMNYYYWPDAWIKRRPGFMTGSGFPMRFADMDGTVLDIYQAATHLVNENGIEHAEGIQFLISQAIGPEQHFGAFGTHYDYTDSFHETALSLAKEHGVALITAEQMLRWLDGRNNSRFDAVEWHDGILTFDVKLSPGAEHAVVMLPLHASGVRVSSIVCGGIQLPHWLETIKGLEYAAFPAASGECKARYFGGDSLREGITAAPDERQFSGTNLPQPLSGAP